MKFIASILILLMLSMVVAPCADAVETDNWQETEQIVKVCEVDGSGSFSEEAQQPDEKCPPVCPCQCCPSTAGVAIEMSQHSAIIPSFLSSDYKDRLSSPFLVLVWSPPQPVS